MRDFPYVNERGSKTVGAVQIDAAIRALWVTWGIFAGLVFALWMIGF